MSKICIGCKQSKDLNEFGKDKYTKDGKYPKCKKCIKNRNGDPEYKKYMKNYLENYRQVKEHQDYNKEYQKQYQKNPKNKQNDKKWRLLKTYGITLEEWYQMFEKQNGECKICHTHQSKLKNKLCVDHDHITGKVRGLLCQGCNSGIGYLKESKRILESAIKYLE